MSERKLHSDAVAQQAEQRFGHPLFYRLSEEEAKLHSRKNKGYAGSNPLADRLGNFRRVSRILRVYPNFNHTDSSAPYIMNVLKHFDNVMFNLGHGGNRALVQESLADMGVYFKLLQCELHEEGQDAFLRDGK